MYIIAAKQVQGHNFQKYVKKTQLAQVEDELEHVLTTWAG
jgi:hypothetical protein